MITCKYNSSWKEMILLRRLLIYIYTLIRIYMYICACLRVLKHMNPLKNTVKKD